MLNSLALTLCRWFRWNRSEGTAASNVRTKSYQIRKLVQCVRRCDLVGGMSGRNRLLSTHRTISVDDGVCVTFHILLRFETSASLRRSGVEISTRKFRFYNEEITTRSDVISESLSHIDKACNLWCTTTLTKAAASSLRLIRGVEEEKYISNIRLSTLVSRANYQTA